MRHASAYAQVAQRNLVTQHRRQTTQQRLMRINKRGRWCSQMWRKKKHTQGEHPSNKTKNESETEERSHQR